MERTILKRNKSVKFSPGTSEDGSGDEAARMASRIRKPARPQRPGHLSIQHGLSNAHLVLRRYAALDGFGAGELSDDEQEILNSPKVAPTQPVDREALQALVSPTDAQLALCSAGAYGQKEGDGPQQDVLPAQLELEMLSKRWNVPTGGLRAVAQIEDGAVGLGMTTYVSKVQSITQRQKVAAAVFVFRGTVLTKRSNFAADLDVWRNANRDLYFAARAVKHLRLEMAQLQRQYPGVQWGFFCTGHSLGGFTAACSAIFFKDILRVTTFESPGLTSFYHSLARQGSCKEYWQTRVVNYLSVPNPINTCQRHLGLMIRVYQQKKDEPLSLAHIGRCLMGTGMQILNCWLAAKVLIRAFKSWSPGVMYLAKRFPALQVHDRDRRVVAGELVLRPAALLGAALSCLRNTGLYMAARLGTTCKEVMNDHSMWNMALAFDYETGRPKRYVEMLSWPRAHRLHRALPTVLAGVFWESFVPTKAAATMRMVFNRQDMVEARVRRLPGYVERVELTRQKGPAYRLRQYASRVMGDMQLPDDEELSDEGDDEISATKYIASREPPTPVRPVRRGRRWGRRMPSPFDDPASSADLDNDEEEDAGQRPSLDEASSAISSEQDLSITNPVNRQERACRKVLQRALTRAALDQDIHAIDEAEGVIAHKERKLERLFSHSNMFQAGMDEPRESDEAPTVASTIDEEESTEEASPESPSTRGWRAGEPAAPPRRRPALKGGGGTMRRMPQMESIAESSGSQPSLREEDLLQSGAVFGDAPSPKARKGSGKRNPRRSLLSKMQRRMQRRTDEDFVTEGGEGLARSTTLPW
ncbi:hypothetical protein ABBQ32_013009 [Trebouxia sp. C0010 RCD-2024]